MDVNSIESAVERLPPEYEPLLLTFYRPPLRVVRGRAVIGTDGGTELHVVPSKGDVVSVAPHGDSPSRFVNSSVEQLARSVAAYARYAQRVAGVDDEAAARRLVDQLRREIAGIDTAATADPEAWWSLILEQADDGLL